MDTLIVTQATPVLVREQAMPAYAVPTTSAPIAVQALGTPSITAVMVESTKTVYPMPRPAVVLAAAASRGEQGIQGPAGPSGSDSSDYVAGESIGGHRVVYSDGSQVFMANKVLAEAEAVVGITTHAAVLGEPLTVQRMGTMAENTWSWAVGPVFLGDNGMLTQTITEAGALLEVGTALSATVLNVRIGTPIEFI